MALNAASWHIEMISAPEQPSVYLSACSDSVLDRVITLNNLLFRLMQLYLHLARLPLRGIEFGRSHVVPPGLGRQRTRSDQVDRASSVRSPIYQYRTPDLTRSERKGIPGRLAYW